VAPTGRTGTRVNSPYASKYAPVGAFLVVVLVAALGVWRTEVLYGQLAAQQERDKVTQQRLTKALAELEEQQAALELEQRVRAEAICDRTVDGSVGQIVSSEVLIRASTADEPEATQNSEGVRLYRGMMQGLWAGTLPQVCEGIINRDVFRQKVQTGVDESLAKLTPG
jgi:hypothetical protein